MSGRVTHVSASWAERAASSLPAMAAADPTTMLWSVRADLAEVANPGRTAVLDLNRVPCPPPYVLEGTAETVWRALGRTPRPTAEVVAEVAAAYDVEPDAIATDVVGFLTRLVDLGLITRVTPRQLVPRPATRLGVRALGVRWAVDLTSVPPELADRLARLWRRATVELTGDERPFQIAPATVRLPIDSSGVPQGVHLNDPAALPYAFSRALTLASLSALGGEALLLHAAALASADGRRAVVLVGPSGAGKSTAVLRLGQRFGYVTDEAVAVTDDLTVKSYPKPVSLAPDPLDPDSPDSDSPDSASRDEPRDTDKVERSPDELGLAATPAAPRLAAVIQLCRSSGVARPRLDRIGVLDAVLGVLPEASAIDKLPEPLHRLVAVLRAGGGPYRLTYADIGDCVDLIAGVLAEPAPAGGLTEDAAGSGELGFPAGAQPVAPGPGLIVRAPWSDAVEEAGEIVVLRGRQPYRLSGIGAGIWLLAADPLSEQQLTAAVVRRHGAHPDAGRLVARGVDELVRLGLLLASPPVGSP